MGKILTAARCPSTVIQVIAFVVDARRDCKARVSNASQITPAVELATAPDQEGDVDSLFYRQYQIWHVIDRADQWRLAAEPLE
eukprot:4050224-Pyramimonas_sp.AAC.1